MKVERIYLKDEFPQLGEDCGASVDCYIPMQMEEMRVEFIHPCLVVCPGGGQLQRTEGPDDLPGHGFDSHANGKILVASLGLGPPVSVCGHLHFAHGVVFNAIFHCVVSFLEDEL